MKDFIWTFIALPGINMFFLALNVLMFSENGGLLPLVGIVFSGFALLVNLIFIYKSISELE